MRETFDLVVWTISNSANNTFVGTFLAGLFLAILGLRFYRQQKRLDVAIARKTKIHELATILLTYVNVAVKDFNGQLGMFTGENGAARAVLNKMNEIDSKFYPKETSARFTAHVKSITKSFDDLSTPLALNPSNEETVKTLAEAIPQITFLLSMTSTLGALDPKTLKETSTLMTEKSALAQDVLVKIIGEND